MCTVSAVYSADGNALRVVINRDERRSRMLARPPARFETGGTAAVWPVDQHAGGTWAGVTENGLAFALLNVSVDATVAPAVEGISRGAIIPCLAAAVDVDDALRRFAAGPARWRCRPFQVLIASRQRSFVATPDCVGELAPPFVLATSTLGDDRVAPPRRALFEELLDGGGDAWAAQDRFHQHAWPDRRHLSVLMSRPDARTVSRTTIVVTADRSELRYAALLDGWPAGVATPPIVLAHRREVVAA